jgi:ring-1,2-phenylacetyl-CoA epoxidase subunit PaaE
MKPSFHPLIIKDIIKETSDAVSVSFEVPAELKSSFSYKSGQYLTLKAIINGEDVRRSYSLCSAPHEDSWKVAIKAIDAGKFSNFANNELKKGDFLEVMNPMGSFVLPQEIENKNFVFFAVGSGVTPVLSMIKSVLAESIDATITFFYGNKGFASIIFREEIEALKNKYMDRLRVIHVLSRESLGNAIQKGRIDGQKCNDLINAFVPVETIDDVFICGPKEMIFAVRDTFVANGLNEKSIHYELFTSGDTPVKQDVSKQEDAISSLVTVIVDGEVLEIPLKSNDINILDAALQAGADLPFACKGGVCCTCKAKIVEGTAKMDVNYALEADEVEAGYILTCQSHPTSEKLIVSFDE